MKEELKSAVVDVRVVMELGPSQGRYRRGLVVAMEGSGRWQSWLGRGEVEVGNEIERRRRGIKGVIDLMVEEGYLVLEVADRVRAGTDN